MAGYAGPYHHSLSNLDDSRKMATGTVGKPRFFIVPQNAPVNEPFQVFCSVSADGLYEFTCDDALVEHVSGANYATITPSSTGDCHISARWFKESGDDYIYGDAKLVAVPIS